MAQMNDEPRNDEPVEREPYEAPRLRVIGTVEEATLGAFETGPDGVGMFASA
jgi:hypothetical protein